MINDIIIEEASTLGFPVGFWPSDMKCPECGKNAHKIRDITSEDYAGGIMVRIYMCEGCEREVHVLND